MNDTATITAPVPRLSTATWFGILALALVLRVAWLVAVPMEPVSDSARYDFFAQRIAKGLGYTDIVDGAAEPTAYWPVGPSFLYSVPYRITGPESGSRFLAASILNLLLGVGSVALLMLVAKRWFSPRVAALAGLLLACWPSQIQFTTVLSSETPMIFFMLAALAAWYAERPPTWLRGILAGIFLAAACYMRPTALLIPAGLALHDLLRRPAKLNTIARTAIATVLMLACIAPWTYRNYTAFDDAFVPISTNGGSNFWMGNNPQTTGGYMPAPPVENYGGEPQRDAALKDEALAYIRAEPLAFAKRTAIKAVRLHERESIGVTWNEPSLTRTAESTADALGLPADPWAARIVLGVKLISNIFWWFVVIAGALGIVRLALSGAWLAALLNPATLAWFYFTAVHAITVIQDRYHFASIPMIAILAAVALTKRPREHTT